MLKEKQTEMPYVGVFKLSSGEEFIGSVIDETETYFMVSKPRCLVPTERGVQYVPLMMLADNDLPIKIPKPVISSKPVAALAGQYESSISGIALPKKSAIIV